MNTGTRATGDGGKDARLTPYTKAKPQRRKRAKDDLDYLRRKIVDLEETLSSLNHVGSPKAFCASDEDKDTRRGIERDDAKEATSPTPSDDVIFSDLNVSLEEQYRHVDSLVETNGIAHVKSEMVGKHYLKQNVQGISFLVEEVRVFPIMFQAMDRATWSCMLSASSELFGQFRTRILEKNHLNVIILDTVQLPKSQPTRVLHRLALRRHFEENRVVLLWSEWLKIDGYLFVRFRFKGASVISSFDFTNGKASSARPQGTIVRNIVDVKPELVELGSTDDWIGEMTDLVLGMYSSKHGHVQLNAGKYTAKISSRTISIDGSLAPPNEGEEDVTERRKAEKYTQGRMRHIRCRVLFARA
ncbi:hypothetical protein PsorP6_008930 [Peronosclerospora sorghi]|uniref:Uncharacterized protein n=1 Tax=Peronosclerospora sorghi TaxID=230839 RepID=A0ACC0VYB7_9STRA|nr:hypothetical protein PsorP6_008930 [Peronosclerospora sorghi]